MKMNTYEDEEQRVWILDDSWEKKKGEKCEEKMENINKHWDLKLIK